MSDREKERYRITPEETGVIIFDPGLRILDIKEPVSLDIQGLKAHISIDEQPETNPHAECRANGPHVVFNPETQHVEMQGTCEKCGFNRKELNARNWEPCFEARRLDPSGSSPRAEAFKSEVTDMLGIIQPEPARIVGGDFGIAGSDFTSVILNATRLPSSSFTVEPLNPDIFDLEISLVPPLCEDCGKEYIPENPEVYRCPDCVCKVCGDEPYAYCEGDREIPSECPDCGRGEPSEPTIDN